MLMQSDIYFPLAVRKPTFSRREKKNAKQLIKYVLRAGAPAINIFGSRSERMIVELFMQSFDLVLSLFRF